MSDDILQKIIAKKRREIERLGFALGAEVPKTRVRKKVRFLSQSGVILEIKKASPSKGDIAPNLDVVALAKTYAKLGAKNISVLSESSFFKGSLNDLRRVADALEGVAILRKDFIIFKEEIAISHFCGADAVLLIARILEKGALLDFALECLRWDLCPFIELAEDSCVKKAQFVLANLAVAKSAAADSRLDSPQDSRLDSHLDFRLSRPDSPQDSQDLADFRVAFGVNSRDLRKFNIDLLRPIALQKNLGQSVIFESGIRGEFGARFAARMGFRGILVGEAAVRDSHVAEGILRGFEGESSAQDLPQDSQRFARFWESVALKTRAQTSPLVKICGITNIDDAMAATSLGADFLGFICAQKSHRCVNAATITAIREALAGRFEKLPLLVGVITELDSQEAKEAIKLVECGVLDALQCHDFVPKNIKNLPFYAAKSIENLADIEALRQGYALPRILLDSPKNQRAPIDKKLVFEAQKLAPLWLAGNLNVENLGDVLRAFCPELVDVCSALERAAGRKDGEKMRKFFEIIKGQK